MVAQRTNHCECDLSDGAERVLRARRTRSAPYHCRQDLIDFSKTSPSAPPKPQAASSSYVVLDDASDRFFKTLETHSIFSKPDVYITPSNACILGDEMRTAGMSDVEAKLSTLCERTRAIIAAIHTAVAVYFIELNARSQLFTIEFLWGYTVQSFADQAMAAAARVDHYPASPFESRVVRLKIIERMLADPHILRQMVQACIELCNTPLFTAWGDELTAAPSLSVPMDASTAVAYSVALYKKERSVIAKALGCGADSANVLIRAAIAGRLREVSTPTLPLAARSVNNNVDTTIKPVLCVIPVDEELDIMKVGTLKSLCRTSGISGYSACAKQGKG